MAIDALLNISTLSDPQISPDGRSFAYVRRAVDGKAWRSKVYVYWSLTGRKIPVEYVVYPREGHGFVEPEHQRDLMERNLRWFSHWLRN